MTNRQLDTKTQSKFNLFLNSYFNIFLAIVLFILLGVAYFTLLQPKLNSIQYLAKINLEEQQNLYNNSQRKLANLRVLANAYKKISATDLQKFNGVLPDKYVKERLFGELEEIIGWGGWLLSNVSITEVDEEKDVAAQPNGRAAEAAANTGSANIKKLKKINIELRVTAIDYPGLKNLLKSLESNLRLFDVTSVKFSETSGTADLSILTYYYNSLK